ncbi:hypothetical protein BC567DRAFT_232492 [Phyllosticta citribraziliensis]
MKVELEKYRKAHPNDKAARRFHYEKDENENEGKTTAAAHERRQLGPGPHLGSHVLGNLFHFNHTSGSHSLLRNPSIFNYTSGFNRLNHKVQHEDKFNKLSKRRKLEPRPFNFTEQELKELDDALKKATKKSKWQVFMDWLREHGRKHKAQEQREFNATAQLNNHKAQHEDKFIELSKRNLEAPPHNHTYTEPEVWFLEYSLKKAKKKPKLQVFLDWMREHDRLHEAQEQRERDTIARLNNHAGHRPDVEHRLTNDNHSDHSPSQESTESHWAAHRNPFMRKQAEVEEMGPAQLLKRWVRHSLTWSNVERPTIHKVPVAAPSSTPDASTTPAAHA